MLGRIRKALGKSQSGEDSSKGAMRPLPLDRLVTVMPPIPRSELVGRFEQELHKLAGVAHRAATTADLELTLRQILSTAHARRVVLSRNPLLAEARLVPKLASMGMTVSQWADSGLAANSAATRELAGPGSPSFREAAFDADVGITGVEFALAETGSLVLTSRGEGAQLASLAPPVHIALYREKQILATLDEVLDRLAQSGGPPSADSGRSVVFVTGTSRTADIEQILIRGVHGPREVHAILIGDACLN